MKVAFFQPYIANWRIEFLSRFIESTTHSVVIYDGGFDNKKDFKSVVNTNLDIPVKRLRSLSPIFKFKKQEYPLYFSPFLFFNLIKDHPDVIITEGEINFINNLSIYMYCKLFRKNYVWWSLGKVRTRNKNIVNSLLDPIVDFLLHNANCVMTRTSWAKEYYVKEKNINPDRVIVAPNSMNEKKARSEVDTLLVDKLNHQFPGKIILYVGALTKEKKPKDLVDAFQLLKTQSLLSENSYLWFVGDGPEKESLIEYVDSLCLDKHVIFFGKIFDGVGSYFQASDIVVVPGLGGLVINHAMIFGKPVISRLADGTELDLIKNDETGYLVESDSIEDLSKAMMKALVPEKLVQMSTNAKNKVDSYWNMNTMITRVEECINFRDR